MDKTPEVHDITFSHHQCSETEVFYKDLNRLSDLATINAHVSSIVELHSDFCVTAILRGKFKAFLLNSISKSVDRTM